LSDFFIPCTILIVKKATAPVATMNEMIEIVFTYLTSNFENFVKSFADSNGINIKEKE